MQLLTFSVLSGVVLSIALLGGCVSATSVSTQGQSGADRKTQDKQSLTAMNWTLTSVQRGSNVLTKLASTVPASQYTLHFTGQNGVQLSGGCNTAGSQYQLPAANKITLGQWLSTKRACLGNLMQADAELIRLLAGVTDYRLAGQQLSLSGAGNTLVFSGAATDETRFGGAGVRKFIEVRNTSQGLIWREAKFDSRYIQINKDTPWLKTPLPSIARFTPAMNREYIVRINEYRDPATGQAVWVKDMITSNGILE